MWLSPPAMLLLVVGLHCSLVYPTHGEISMHAPDIEADGDGSTSTSTSTRTNTSTSTSDGTSWDPGYLPAFRDAVLASDPELCKTDANLLAMLWARTGENQFGLAASAALRMTASATKPKWLSTDRSWDAPAWYSFNLSNTTFQQPARFSGCTDYGLVGYYILQSGGWTFSDWKAEGSRDEEV